jgi:Zn-dependent protease with chaperone function
MTDNESTVAIVVPGQRVPEAMSVEPGRSGVWRAAAACPAIAGSLLLLTILFGWMGAWEGAVLLVWLGAGFAIFTRLGERIVVPVACRFRAPTPGEQRALAPLWSAALVAAGLADSEVDLYVQRSDQVNACATGRRSIAVTSAVVEEFTARRLTDEHVTAILVHELGHRQAGATAFSLAVGWLAAPWRITYRLVIRIALSTRIGGRRQPLPLLALVVITTVVAAVAQAIQHRQWATAVTLSVVTTCAVACPLLDAAISRHGEYTADRFAAERGLGPQLADALRTLDHATPPRRWSLTERALSSHPELQHRVEAIRTVGERSSEFEAEQGDQG